MSNDAQNTIHLGDIADIRPGYPFRGAIKESSDGDAALIQIKNVHADSGIDWASLAKVKLIGRKQPDWLEKGDLVFTARGNRNAAASIEQVPCKAVAAPHLYLVRIKDKHKEKVLPGFIAWLMNQVDAQRYFLTSATGSYITSIRKPVLQKLPITLPSIEKQALVVQLEQAARRESALLEQLIENRKQQLALVARTLMD